MIEDLLWSNWSQMPSPETCRRINAPTGPGVYQIRHISTKDKVLFGIGIECQKRMKSLFPKPYGVGTRNNGMKRDYILENWKDLEYHTLKRDTREKAKQIEDIIKSKRDHLFNT
jgi:hypothetical protein